MINGSATTTAPRTAKKAASSLYAPEPRHHDTTSEHGYSSVLATEDFRPYPRNWSCAGDELASHGDHHFLRFLAYFSGPIVWAVEIATVLLIVLTHSLDFVGVVIIANLVMIVVMMVFRTSLGLWQDSHPASSLDILNRHRTHHFRLHTR